MSCMFNSFIVFDDKDTKIIGADKENAGKLLFIPAFSIVLY